SHTYTANGTYTVSLTVTDNKGGKGSTSQSVTLGATTNPPPVASFTASCTGLACAFTDASSDPGGSVVAWSWDFGDGTKSTAQPPTAACTASCTGLTCALTSTSSDPGGSVVAWSWSFGDGTTSTAQNPTHGYAAGGTYTVGLTVTDNGGSTGSTSQSITVTGT